MLIELINCNKINVSLHCAHFCMSYGYVYNCKTVSSSPTLACCAVSFARKLINSLHALDTFGIVIQIGTQSCDNGFFDFSKPSRDGITCFTWVPVAQIPAWCTVFIMLLKCILCWWYDVNYFPFLMGNNSSLALLTEVRDKFYYTK